MSMVIRYAREFGMNPDEVFNKTSFYSVKNILVTLKEEQEFQDRYSELDKALNQAQQ